MQYSQPQFLATTYLRRCGATFAVLSHSRAKIANKSRSAVDLWSMCEVIRMPSLPSGARSQRHMGTWKEIRQRLKDWKTMIVTKLCLGSTHRCQTRCCSSKHHFFLHTELLAS